MTVRKKIGVLALAGTALAAVGMVARAMRPGTHARATLHHRMGHVRRAARHTIGRIRGISYKARRRHPEPNVADDVLADRVRSALGPLEKHLDVPRVHITVQDHIVMLHGSVGSDVEESEIERAAAMVSGVRGVESHMHVGLGPGNRRPSAGRAARARLRSVAAGGHASEALRVNTS